MELENLVAPLVHGELALKEPLHQFEYGVILMRDFQIVFRPAEQKVRKLIEHEGQLKWVPFNPIAD